MLDVLPPDEVTATITALFGQLRTAAHALPIAQAAGRTLAQDVTAPCDVPAFDRSAVDGYAVRAADTFGSSESLPALLRCSGRIEMGKAAPHALEPGCCMAVPTGGMLPPLADAAVMIERCEDFGDGTIGVTSAVSPGQNCVFRGDDVHLGDVVLPAGIKLLPHHIGTLAALGAHEVRVHKPPVCGVLSTGDELVPGEQVPQAGQVRDVNAPLLCAAIEEAGGEAVPYGICRDDLHSLKDVLADMAHRCDVVLLSGGSSVGELDAAPRAIEALGKLHLHGIAMKPGKPSIVGEIGGVPVFGLPGNPVAAYFVFRLFAAPLLKGMQGAVPTAALRTHARLGAALPSNHGREECVAVRLEEREGELWAEPIMGKSALITKLSRSDGYIRIPRDCEGLPAGAPVRVIPF